MPRIAIVGTSCSGKTTLARRVAELYQVPHVELDSIHWQPNWVFRPAAEFRALVAEAVAQEDWVIDGNYSQARDLIWSRATMVVWLHYRFPVVFRRALIRTVRRAADQEVLFSGNRESFRRSFWSKDSILLWVITSHRRVHRQYRDIIQRQEFPHLEVVELRSPRATDQWLETQARLGRAGSA